MKVEFNGESREIDSGDGLTVDLVRDELGLTGTKLVCGGGVCGACTVHLDGRPVASCLLPVAALDGHALTTVEGVGPDHPFQRAMMSQDGLQCGFCTPGFVMAGSAFHDRWRVERQNERPARDVVTAALSGHAATVLAAANLPEPDFVNGIQQMPLHGVDMSYAFDDPTAPEARETQYFEVFCNRGIYHKGWTAVTRHSVPWLFGAQLPNLDDDVWELYDTTTDWAQAHDIAADHPEKLEQLKRLWLIEAVKYNVLPLDDRRIERFNTDIAGRPVLVKGKSQTLYGGMTRLSENSVLNLKNKSHTVTAQVSLPDGVGTGVIIAQGGAFAGWSLYLHEGKPTYCHNLAGLQRFYVRAESAVPAGEHQVRMEFAYDGGGLAKGGDVTLYIDGAKVGQGRVDATVPMLYSADETCDLGSDSGMPVSEDYTSPGSRFNGTIKWVQLDTGDEDHDHLVSPEERMRVATARQ